MIYAIVGTEVEERKKGRSFFNTLGSVARIIRSENVHELESHVYAQDLFEESPILILIEEISQDGDGREVLTKLLPVMKESRNIFLIDEPLALMEVKKEIKAYAEKVFEAMEKKKERIFPFGLCNAIATRDKKNAWVEWMKVRDEETELVVGAIWWQVKKVWVEILDGRKKTYTREEIEKLGESIVVMQHEAHRGKVDLKREVEKIMLSL